MALDWSVMQIPSYMAAQDMRSAAADVGGAIGALTTAGLTRHDLSGKNVKEGIIGQGRSFFKDHVKGEGEFKNYEDWIASGEAGRYLQLAEAGASFRKTPEGEWKVKTPKGKWETMGGKGAEEDALWDPYYQKDDITDFEGHMQGQFMSPDWTGGDYTYRSSMSPLEAFFSREKLRPVSNLYHEQAMKGIGGREGTLDWSGLEAKGNLGWYPGKYTYRQDPKTPSLLKSLIKKFKKDEAVVENKNKNIDIIVDTDTKKNGKKNGDAVNDDKKTGGAGFYGKADFQGLPPRKQSIFTQVGTNNEPTDNTYVMPTYNTENVFRR